MKVSDLYFHVAPDYEEIESLIVYITPIDYWEENKCMDDSFWVDPDSNLAKEFNAAGIESCEIMEGVYELNYGATVDDIQNVIKSIEKSGFKRSKEFSEFMTKHTEHHYVTGGDELTQKYKPESETRKSALNKPVEETIERLQVLLDIAVRNEDYMEAARLRDKINAKKD